MRTLTVGFGLLVVLACAAQAKSVTRSSQGVLAVNVSNPDDWDDRGLGIQAGFLQRYGLLAIGGEADYLRARSIGSEAGRFWLALATAEISLVRLKPRIFAPYFTGGLGLSAWERGFNSESNYIWALGIGIQYGLGGRQASAIFVQARSFRVFGDEDHKNYPMVLVSAGYRLGL